MTESRMFILTSKLPGGGAGISMQIFITYLSIGAFIQSVLVAKRYSWARYSRNALTYGQMDKIHKHRGMYNWFSSEQFALISIPASPTVVGCNFSQFFQGVLSCGWYSSYIVKHVPYTFRPLSFVITKWWTLGILNSLEGIIISPTGKQNWVTMGLNGWSEWSSNGNRAVIFGVNVKGSQPLLDISGMRIFSPSSSSLRFHFCLCIR